MDWKNRLYFGDNLDILRREVPDACVDLIYLDPPFNSNATYNVLFKEKSGEESAAQITAFEDTWQWSNEPEVVYREIVESGPRKLSDLMQALLAFLGRNDMMAYLVTMAIRLVELHRVLKPTGTIYLHCDMTASHYLKLVLDAVFGPDKFDTEIMPKHSSAHGGAKQGRRHHDRIHDVVFFCTRSFDSSPPIAGLRGCRKDRTSLSWSYTSQEAPCEAPTRNASRRVTGKGWEGAYGT